MLCYSYFEAKMNCRLAVSCTASQCKSLPIRSGLFAVSDPGPNPPKPEGYTQELTEVRILKGV